MKTFKKNIKIIFAAVFVFFCMGISSEIRAVNFADNIIFNVDKDFDASGRIQIAAALLKETNNLYIYVEKPWWESQSSAKQLEVLGSLDVLSYEFENKIYPTLTSVFGSEWKPGVDNDNKITVLFQSMNSTESGYFREADEYVKLQVPTSNEREMLYLSLDRITSPYLKMFLAHEFVHLITFNQKNKIFGTEEDVWLNEARADYALTILGYDDNYDTSNIRQRVKDFVENPSDSITEWLGTKYDYASANMFVNYMVDHYGVYTLIDSLKSEYAGIESINYALKKSEIEDNFDTIFTNWTIASVFNNCSVNQKYCYLNKNLKNFRLNPALNFLPLTGDVSLSVAGVTKNWTGNWIKFIGGKGNLRLYFSSLKGLTFRIPYIVEDSAGSYAVRFVQLDENEKGSIQIDNFGTDYRSLIIIPSLQSQVYELDGIEPTYPYSYKVEVSRSSASKDQDLIQELLDRIEALKQEIAIIQGRSEDSPDYDYCYEFGSNLYFGMVNNSQVKCLQDFLKNQGPDIYLEGLVTGNFANLTMAAVIRFQEKYASEILTPIGLEKGTGYVGRMTRAKINQILSR